MKKIIENIQEKVHEEIKKIKKVGKPVIIKKKREEKIIRQEEKKEEDEEALRVEERKEENRKILDLEKILALVSAYHHENNDAPIGIRSIGDSNSGAREFLLKNHENNIIS